MFRKISAAAALSLAVGLGATAPAHATTFAVFNPVVGTVPNIKLSGLSLTSNNAVIFDYKAGNALIALGDIAAKLSLNATETSAGFAGPGARVYGLFDGTFSITSTVLKTVGSLTVHPGDTLLSGTFGDLYVQGHGTGLTFDANLSGGDLVDFNDNAFVQFSPPGGDEGMSGRIGSLNTPISLSGGQLSNFVGVAQGAFDADNLVTTGGGTPEPGTWALMLIGIGGIGYAARRRAKFAIA